MFALAAATAPPTPKPTATPGPQTQRALADYKAADSAMANQWRITNAFMKGKDAQDHRRSHFAYADALLTSQRAWISYRDAACRVEGGVHAGDVRQALIVAQCKTALTNARRLQLKGLMANE
ncbi:lysozyme inhibitor LprI family protein [Sphingomonas panacis]|nr:lysozyme inhibitor LprI family protein [Sphingomonas panacis]